MTYSDNNTAPHHIPDTTSDSENVLGDPLYDQTPTLVHEIHVVNTEIVEGKTVGDTEKETNDLGK